MQQGCSGKVTSAGIHNQPNLQRLRSSRVRLQHRHVCRLLSIQSHLRSLRLLQCLCYFSDSSLRRQFPWTRLTSPLRNTVLDLNPQRSRLPRLNMPSILSDEDKQVVKRTVPKPSNKIHAVAVARLYIAYPDRLRWTYTGLQGAAVLAEDRVGNTFWIKLVDISVSF